MAEWNRPNYGYGPTVARGDTTAIDQGLRAYMIRVYNYMGLGLLITGLAAYATFAGSVDSTGHLTSFGYALFASPLRWVVIFAPLALVFLLGFRIDRMEVSTAQIVFWIYAGLVGLSLGSIFLVYTATSITQTFFITAAAFGALSLYGYTTQRDLSGMGSFLLMGVVGIILASLVNLFLRSSGLQFAISVIGVLCFAGLTAWDTQRIKEMYFAGDSTAVAGRKAIMGALSLYLDFLNLFMFLLQFMGARRD